jgi:hypothetical protein
MNAVTKPQALEPEIMEMVLADGDLSRLSTEQRLSYYARVCETQGLNPLTRPFDYVKLNGKLVLYAKRECTDQKRKLDGVSIQIVDKRVEGDLFIVTARATNAAGRVDEDMGAVSIAGLRGEALANATLKAMTKAKRRVTLSICGMGMLDESEVESVQQQEREVASTVMRDTAKALPARPYPARKMDPVQSLDDALGGDRIPDFDAPKPVDKAAVGVQALEAQIRAATTEEDLHAIAGSPQVEKQRAWLAKHRPELDQMLADTLGERYQQLVQARLEAEEADPSLMLDRPTVAATA